MEREVSSELICGHKPLEFEHFSFEAHSAGAAETADLAVAADDPMTRDNQRQRIVGKGCADGAAGSCPACRFCQLPVSNGPAGLYLPAGPQNRGGERAYPVQIDPDVSKTSHISAFIVIGYALLELRKVVGVEAGWSEVGCKPLYYAVTVRAGKVRPDEAVLRAGQAEVAPAGTKYHVSQRLCLIRRHNRTNSEANFVD
jgi:hypothetical protein